MEIGQKVKWSTNTIGDIQCVGVFLQQISDELSEVICHYMNDKQCVKKMQVATKQLLLA